MRMNRPPSVDPSDLIVLDSPLWIWCRYFGLQNVEGRGAALCVGSLEWFTMPGIGTRDQICSRTSSFV